MKFEIDNSAINLLAGESTAELVDAKGYEILENMKRLVPTDSTALLRSLANGRDGVGENRVNRVGVRAGFEYKGQKPEEYQDHVENGTSKAPAQPFKKPALLQARQA